MAKESDTNIYNKLYTERKQRVKFWMIPLFVFAYLSKQGKVGGMV